MDYKDHSKNKPGLNLLTPAELSNELGVCRRTLRRWEKAGMLPSICLNKRVVRFRRCDVETMLERFSVEGRAR